MADSNPMEAFLSLSALLTGYTKTDLLATGLAGQYYDKLSSIVDEDICGALWTATREAMKGLGIRPKVAERRIRKLVLSNAMLAPLAINIIAMWYLSSWSQLPQAWRSLYGAKANDVDHVISAEAYQEGLVWQAIGAHPQGAKQQGYGAWGLPPPWKLSPPWKRKKPRLKRRRRAA